MPVAGLVPWAVSPRTCSVGTYDFSSGIEDVDGRIKSGHGAPTWREGDRAAIGQRGAQDAERRPQDRSINRQSESEVGDEPVLADLDPVGEAAFDHVPAERSLQK